MVLIIEEIEAFIDLPVAIVVEAIANLCCRDRLQKAGAKGSIDADFDTRFAEADSRSRRIG